MTTSPASPETPPPEVSPLTQVSPTSLNDLFNKDPETLTPEEEDRIIVALRADRARFLVEDSAKPVRAKSASKTKTSAVGLNLTLDDLNL